MAVDKQQENIRTGDTIHFNCPEYADTKFAHIGNCGKVIEVKSHGVWVSQGLGLSRFVPWADIQHVEDDHAKVWQSGQTEPAEEPGANEWTSAFTMRYIEKLEAVAKAAIVYGRNSTPVNLLALQDALVGAGFLEKK